MRRGGILLTILAALAAFAVGASYKFYSVLNTDIAEIKKTINYDEQHGTINLLVLGIDDVEAVHRSDTIILARIDIDTKKASVMSIPRDTRVSIKGQKTMQKINHAYAYGGMELLRDTVINLTGVPVNYYLIVNYDAFPKIVDAVGGVDINVEKRMKYTDNAQKLHIDFRPGMQHMNGVQALKYVRFRMDAMGDIGRMKRQQEFSKALIKKIETPTIISRLPELIETVLSQIQTDIPVKTAIALAGQLKDMTLKDIHFFTMPGDPAYISNISYFIPDLQKASREMDPNYSPEGESASAPAQTESEDAEPVLETLSEAVAALKTPIAVLNGTGISGIAKQFTKQFEQIGIEVAFTGNAKHSGFEYCVIHYPESAGPEAARRLADICGIPRSLVKKANIAYPAALVIGKKNHADVLARLKSQLEREPEASNDGSAVSAADAIAGIKTPFAVLNGTSISGLARRFKQQFNRLGVSVSETANADNHNYENCTVQYSEGGDYETARMLAALCGIPSGRVQKADIAYPVALVLGKKDHSAAMDRLKTLPAK